MEELHKSVSVLQTAVRAAVARLHLEDARVELQTLEAKSQSATFWDDPKDAQEAMQRISRLSSLITPWDSLLQGLDEIVELLDLQDASMEGELRSQLETLNLAYEALKEDLKYNGPYDAYDTIMSIYAGAGGTDAQDWAQMLLRMYVRYADLKGWKVATIDESAGDEAGIKSVTLQIAGNYAYGRLKGEHGVHRLVRLSPFNADNLRQTSFAKVEIMPKIDRPDDILIDDKELKVDVYRSGGHGGQSVNTTDSAVRITHLPTGITVAIQNERSQLQNKETAMTILRSRLAQLRLEQHQERLTELKGPNQSAEWGNQIRSYVLHPYKQVKDLRTRHESSDPDAVLSGDLDGFIDAYLDFTLGEDD